ncbi:MAG: NfeD family protein [Planctomycetota bacterium]
MRCARLWSVFLGLFILLSPWAAAAENNGDGTGSSAATGAAADDEPVAPQSDDDEVQIRLEPPPALPPGSYGTVARITIEGMIDKYVMAYLERALREARERGADTVLTVIESDGGLLFAGREMMKQVLDAANDHGLRMIAYIDYKAISAAAMIAYGHQEIYITSSATIGNIGVIRQTAEGEISYAPEKIETVVRELLNLAADNNDWNPALLRKMTARNQELYAYRLADGSWHMVLKDDVPRFEATHPAFDPERPEQKKVLLLGEDRLLTYTGTRAERHGMVTAVVDDLDALYARTDIDPSAVIALPMTVNERVARALGSWAPLLAGLAVLFVFFELKTAGVGLFAILAAICGGLFIICQYYAQMAGHIEIVLLVLGTGLLITEFLTAFGGGMIGIAGGAMVVLGLLLSFMSDAFQFDPGAPEFVSSLSYAAMRALFAIVVMCVGLVIAVATLPHSRIGRRLAVTAEIGGTANAEGPSSPIGQCGLTLSALHPGGSVLVDGEECSARSEHGAFIAKGLHIEVIGRRFGELVVRPAAEQDEDADPEDVPA